MITIKFVTKNYYDALAEKIRDAKTRLARTRMEKSAAINEDVNGWHDNFAFEQAARAERMIEDEINILSAELNACQVCPQPNGTAQFPFAGKASVGDSPGGLSMPMAWVDCSEAARRGSGYSCVEIWTTVTIRDTNTGAIQQLSIVPIGAEDVRNNIFSYIAPIAAPLMDAKPGDIIDVSLPTKNTAFEVLEITKFMQNPEVI